MKTFTMKYCAYFALAILVLVNSSKAQEDIDSELSSLAPVPAIEDPCDPSRSVLDGLTHRFRSDCGPRQWCKPTTTFDRDPLLALSTPDVISVPAIKRQELQVPSLGLPTTLPVVYSPPPSPFSTSRQLPAAAATVVTASAAAPPPSPSPSNDFAVCVEKRCRRDEFPFGYKGVPFEQLPPQCDNTTYCPDDESECKPLIPLGKQCQLNRDDSCEPANQGSYRTLCLQGLCRQALSNLGELCIIDSTAYLGYNESGHEVIATVTRDDCQDSLYCDESNNNLQCKPEKLFGSTCLENRECIDFNCNMNMKICEIAPQSLHQLPLWSWILIACFIIVGLLFIVLALYRLHLRHRLNRSEEIDQFFSEQWTYRHSILSMHAAAAMASARTSHISHQTQSDSSHDKESGKGTYNDDDDCHHDQGAHSQGQAWASSLDVKASPNASWYQASTHTLSPRLAHRRTPSL